VLVGGVDVADAAGLGGGAGLALVVAIALGVLLA